MRDQLYYGVGAIAERLGVGKHTARKLIKSGAIRADKSKTGAWYTVESTINEDIQNMPGKL